MRERERARSLSGGVKRKHRKVKRDKQFCLEMESGATNTLSRGSGWAAGKPVGSLREQP